MSRQSQAESRFPRFRISPLSPRLVESLSWRASYQPTASDCGGRCSSPETTPISETTAIPPVRAKITSMAGRIILDDADTILSSAQCAVYARLLQVWSWQEGVPRRREKAYPRSIGSSRDVAICTDQPLFFASFVKLFKRLWVVGLSRLVNGRLSTQLGSVVPDTVP
jgi:hypothetical protein